MRRAGIIAAVLLLAISVGAFTLLSQAVAAPIVYPRKTVTLNVNFPPGGLADQSARALAEHAKPFFPRTIAVINRPGGTGTVGATEVIMARPDGHTIGLSPVAPMVVIPQREDLPYKGPADYAPVVKVVKTVFVLAVHPDAPWKTIDDVVNAAKESPGRIGVGVGGLGSIPHMILETVKERAGVEMSVVPFGGDPELTPALLGGHVRVAVILPLSVHAHSQAGKVRVLGTFDVQRHPLFPDVPTFRERGLDIVLTAYTFVFAPKETPDFAINRLHSAFKRAIHADGFKTFADRAGLLVDYAAPDDLQRQLENDWAFYDRLLRRLKMKK